MAETAPTLPLHDATPCERADAARNRALLLDAARQIVEHEGVQGLTMQAVADAAGVGKGTVFRRFEDRAGLLHALVDDDEVAFQENLLRGPAPLGPGSPPAERLAAFGVARIAFVLRHGEVLRAAERSECGSVEHPVRTAHRMHLQVLLRDAGHDEATATYMSGALISALEPKVILGQIEREGLDPDQLEDGWRTLVAAAASVAA